VLAFLDIHPTALGHTLVIPKTQVEFAWDLDDASYQQLMLAVKKIAFHLRETLNVPYVGEKIVGTDVPHTHIHLIPFTHESEYHHQADLMIEPDHAALAKLAASLAL